MYNFVDKFLSKNNIYFSATYLTLELDKMAAAVSSVKSLKLAHVQNDLNIAWICFN